MDINTSNYQLAWGRKPSGQGHWAFQFYTSPESKWRDQLEFAPDMMKYSEAKAWALKRAKELAAWKVAVAS